MKCSQRARNPFFPTITACTLALLMSGIAAVGSAQTTTRPGKNLAQKLVEAAQAKHPDAAEIGISATIDKGCVGIASTDKTDIGEKCEADDIVPIRTGKPSVEKEKNGFDVSVLLHDATGKVVGVLGIGFKAAAGQTESSAVAKAKQIEAEMAAQIPSKARLLARPE